jgi:hypothetical protein
LQDACRTLKLDVSEDVEPEKMYVVYHENKAAMVSDRMTLDRAHTLAKKWASAHVGRPIYVLAVEAEYMAKAEVERVR